MKILRKYIFLLYYIQTNLMELYNFEFLQAITKINTLDIYKTPITCISEIKFCAHKMCKFQHAINGLVEVLLQLSFNIYPYHCTLYCPLL